MINALKILFVLKNIENSLSTRELSKKTSINFRNIGRYLKSLEELNYIVREVQQEGKKRYIINSLTAKGFDYNFSDSCRKYLELFFK